MYKKRGQSILEYVIVLTVIVAAVLVGVLIFASQNQSAGLGQLMYKAGGVIEKSADDISTLKVK